MHLIRYKCLGRCLRKNENEKEKERERERERLIGILDKGEKVISRKQLEAISVIDASQIYIIECMAGKRT